MGDKQTPEVKDGNGEERKRLFSRWSREERKRNSSLCDRHHLLRQVVHGVRAYRVYYRSKLSVEFRVLLPLPPPRTHLVGDLCQPDPVTGEVFV